MCSWLVRLAAAHGMKTRSLVSSLTGEEVEFTCDLNGPAGDELLSTLVRSTGLDFASVRLGHTFVGFCGRLYAKAATATPWMLPLGPSKNPRPSMQFCPLCLQEPQPYLRRVWRMSLFTTCPRHRVGLHHVCPHCTGPIIPVRTDRRFGTASITQCWRCGHDVTSTPASPVSKRDASLALRHLEALQRGIAPPAIPAGTRLPDYFAGLAILYSRLLLRRPRLRRFQELAAEGAGIDALPTPPARHATTAFDSLVDPAHRRNVMCAADWLLEEWPERFLGIASAAGTRTSDFLCYFSMAPQWFLEPLRTRLTPPRRKPTLSPGVIRARERRDFIIAHRSEWSASKLPRLIRALRAAGYYQPATDDCVIMRSLPGEIARLRTAGADYRKKLTVLVPRETPEWTRLLLMAKPYRKIHCKSAEILRRGIRLLCADQFLSSRDLGGLLHRSHVALMVFHLTPMVRAGELKTRFGENRGGTKNFPGQGYQTVRDDKPTSRPTRGRPSSA